MSEKIVELECNRADCLANNNGWCMALNAKAKIRGKGEKKGYTHWISKDYKEHCPFFLDREQEAKDLARLKERLGIDGERRK